MGEASARTSYKGAGLALDLIRWGRPRPGPFDGGGLVRTLYDRASLAMDLLRWGRPPGLAFLSLYCSFLRCVFPSHLIDLAAMSSPSNLHFRMSAAGRAAETRDAAARDAAAGRSGPEEEEGEEKEGEEGGEDGEEEETRTRG